MLNWRESDQVKAALLSLSNRERKALVKAVLMLNRSLEVTQGPDWLDKATGAEIPYDIYSTVRGGLVADERGVLRRAE